MTRFGIICLSVLLLIAASDAGRKYKRPRLQRTPIKIPEPDVCQNVQSFEKNKKSVFDYEATIESTNDRNPNATSGKRIRCHEVTIRVPSMCFGIMDIRNCTVYEGVPLPNGSLAYTQRRMVKLEKQLGRNNLYFHFNEGEIGKIFYHKNESTEVINMKRSILSALQFKFNEKRLSTSPLNTVIDIPEVNVFGRGSCRAKVEAIEYNHASQVKVTRQLDGYELPWSRHQWSNLRSVFEKTDLGDLATEMFVDQSKEIVGNATQNCTYKLERGRQVKEVYCVEHKPMNIFNNSLFKLFGDQFQGSLATNTTIQLKINRTIKEDMGRKDQWRRIERKHMVKHYTPENLMFEEQWEESIKSQFKTFNPVDAMYTLVSAPENITTPALFSKLARYVSRLSETDMRGVWVKIQTRTSEDRNLLIKATNLWIQILNGCNNAPYWCPLPECEPNQACQVTLTNFIEANTFTSLTEGVQQGIIEGISTMSNPNVSIVSAAHQICRVNLTAKTVVMLGRAIYRCSQEETCDRESRQYVDAKDYLLELIRPDCTSQQQNTYIEKTIKIAAIKGLAVLGEQGIFARDTLIRCASNPTVPKELSINAVRALQEMPLSVEQRSMILAIIQDRSRPATLRLTAYLLLINSEPTQVEIEAFVQIVTREGEPRPLKFYVINHIKSQLLMKNTDFCEFSNSTVNKMMSVVQRHQETFNFVENEVLTEKRYVFNQTMMVPIVNKEMNCTVSARLLFTKLSMVPTLANVTITTEVNESNVTLLETTLDFSKILAVIEPLMGQNGLLPKDGVESFLNLPLSSLIKPILRDAPLLSRDELQKLTMIQDEAVLAYQMLLMKNKSPLEMKVLGYPINYETIMNLPYMENLKLKNIWKIVDVLEKGWEFNRIIADQPLLAHVATPSSVGAPHILHLEASYFFHQESKVVAPVQRIFLTQAGTIDARSKIAIEASLMLNQRIQLPAGLSTGTGHLMNIGHNMSVSGSIEVQPKSVTFDIRHIAPKMKIISLKTIDLVVNDSQAYPIKKELRQECPSICIWPEPSCPETTLYYKACIEPAMDIGLYLNNSMTDRLRFGVVWSSWLVENEHSRHNKIYSVNMTLASGESFRNNMGEAKVIYNGQGQGLTVDLYKRDQPWKRIEANGTITFMDRLSTIRLVDQMLVSFNVTSLPENTVAVSKLFVSRSETGGDLLDLSLPWFGVESEEEEMASYNIDSALNLPGFVEGSSKGKMLVHPENGRYSINMTVKSGQWENGSPLFVVNVTSSRRREQAMDGYYSEIKIDNRCESCAAPRSQKLIAYLNKYSTFHYTGTSMKDSTGNSKQDMVVKAYLKNNAEPYYFYAASRMNKLNNDNCGPYIYYLTYTINKVQLHLDLAAPTSTQAKIMQRIVVPSVSIPVSRMRHCHHCRIEASDSELKPVAYTTDMFVGSNQTNGFKLEFKTLKQKYNESVDDRVSSTVFGRFMYDAQPKSYDLKVELSGLKIEGGYGKYPDWHGHSVVFDMDPTYLNYMPISNQTKDIIERYGKSKNNDSIKFGYVFKSNFTSQIYFYEAGYFVGDKKLVLATNVTLPKTPLNLNNLSVIANLTCDKCLILADASFKWMFVLRTEETDLVQWRGMTADKKHLFDIALGFQVQDGVETGMGFNYTIVKDHGMIVDLNSTANITLTPKKSYISYFVEQPQYVYFTAMNLTLLQKGDGKTSTIYALGYPIGFHPGAPWMVGNWTASSLTNKQQETVQDICPLGQKCLSYTSQLTQLEQCKDYSAFYGEESEKFSAVNCTVQTFSFLLSPHGTWNFTFEHDGRKNPDLMLKRLIVKNMLDVNYVLTSNITVNMSRHILSSPLVFKANLTTTGQRTGYEAIVESPEINGYVLKGMDENNMIANVSTQKIPFEFNCTLTANFESLTSRYHVRECGLAYPPMWNVTMETSANVTYESLMRNTFEIEVRNRSSKTNMIGLSTDMGEGRGKYRVYCGDKSDKKSPCNVTLSIDRENVKLNAKVKSIYFNHTTKANLTGLSRSSIFDMRTSVNTSTILRLAPTLNNTVVSCKYCVQQRSVYKLDAIVAENKIELVRVDGKSSYMPLLRDSASLYFHYVKNETADHDILAQASLGERKFETGVYQGENQPDVRGYLESEVARSYLEYYYLKYTQCQENMTVGVKNIYNSPNVRVRSLIKMETKARSNMWPISCNAQWREIFQQILPMTPITPVCANDMDLKVLYDWYSRKQISFNIRKENKTVVNGSYRLENNVHKLSAICQDEINPSCRLNLTLADRLLTFNSTVNTSYIKHAALLTLTTTPSTYLNQPAIVFNMSTNNTVETSYPVQLNLTTTYSDEESWYVHTKLNVSEKLRNVFLVENGTLKKLLLEGKAIPIFWKPRDWNVTYSQKKSRFELYTDIKFDVQSRLTALYYEGKNKTEVGLQLPDEPSTDKHVEGYFLNYTTCGEHVILNHSTVLAEKEGRHLVTESFVNVSMSPFTSRSILMLPFVVTCPLCVGKIEFSSVFNTTEGNQMLVEMLVDQATLLKMNYTYGQDQQSTEYFINGMTDLIYGIQATTPQRMYLSSNATVLSNEHFLVNVTAARKNFNRYNYFIKEHFKIQPNGQVKQHLTFDTDVVSVLLNMEQNSRCSKVSFKYPYKTETGMKMTVDLCGDELKITDLVGKLSTSEMRLEKVFFTAVRFPNMSFSGIKMDELTMKIRSNLHYKQPDVIPVYGSASAIAGEKWYVHVYDPEQTRFLVSSNCTNAPMTECNTNIRVRLPSTEFELKGGSNLRQGVVKNDYNSTMKLLHCVSESLVPVFHLRVQDNLVKSQQGIYHGALNWQANIWSSCYPTYHINPTFNLVSKERRSPRSNLENLVTSNFTMGDYFVRSQFNFTNTMQESVDLLTLNQRNVTMFVPTMGEISAEVMLPFLKSKHVGQIKPRKFHCNTNATVSYQLPIVQLSKEIFNFSQIFDLSLTAEERLLVGSIRMNGSIKVPMSSTFKREWIIAPVSLPSGRAVRKFSVMHKYGENEPVVCNVTAMTRDNSRQLNCSAFGRSIFNTTMIANDCVMSLPLLPGWLCMPRIMELRSIEANLPIAALLRQMATLRSIVPDTPLLDIKMKNSSVKITTTTTRESNWNVTAVSQMQYPTIGQEVYTEIPTVLRAVLPSLYTTNSQHYWNMTASIVKTPMGIELLMDSQMNTSILIDHIRIHTKKWIRPVEIIVKVKTTGKLRKYLPVDLDVEYKLDSLRRNWTFSVHKCHFEALEHVKANVTFKTDQSLYKNVEFKWNVTSDKMPIFEHTYRMKFEKKSDRHPLRLDTLLRNKYISLNATNELGTGVYNLTISIPTQTKNANLTLELRNRKPVKLTLKTDTALYSCNTTTQVRHLVVMNCTKKEIYPNGTIDARETPIAPTKIFNPIVPSSSVQFVKDVVYSHFTNQTGINDILRSVFDIRNAQVRKHIAEFIVNITSELKKDVKALYQLSAEKYWQDAITGLLDSIPTIMPLSQYFQKKLLEMKPYMETAMKMRVLNGTNYIAMQYNISSVDPSNVMLQCNFSTFNGLPIANLTILTPYSEMFLLLDIGSIPFYKPIKAGIKSLTTPGNFSVNMNCTDTSRPCALAELTSTNGNHYHCKAIKSQNPTTPWRIVCNKIEQGHSHSTEVASFTIPEPTPYNVLKTLSALTTTYIDGQLETYLDEAMNIPQPNTFSDDLTKTVSHCYETLKLVCFSIFPEKTINLHRIERLGKEVASMFVYLGKSESERQIETDLLTKLAKSGVNYLSSVTSRRGVKIPLVKLSLLSLEADLYVELGKTDRRVAIVCDTRLPGKSDLNQELRASIHYVNNYPIVRYSVNNTFVWAFMDVSLRNSSLVRGAIGFPDTDNYVNVTYVAEPNAQMKRYRLEFVDTENSKYECDIQQINPQQMTVRCTTLRSGETTPVTVCQFNRPASAMNTINILTEAGLLIPETYVAAENPIMFKNYLRTIFHVNEPRTLNVISTYLSNVSKVYIDRLHKDYVDFFVDKVFNVPSMIKKDWSRDLVSAIMTNEKVIEACRRSKTPKRALMEAVATLVPSAIDSAKESIKVAKKSIEHTQLIVKQLPSIFSPYYEPMTQIYTVFDLAKKAGCMIKSVELNQEKFLRVIFDPTQFNNVMSELYMEIESMKYIANLFKISGPVSQYISDRQSREVISFNQESYFLPSVESDSECEYVFLTDPLNNQFNIISKGNSLIMAFPNQTVEMTQERRVYVVTRSSERREVTLPYFGHEVSCYAAGRDAIECKCMEYKITLKTSEMQKVYRTVTVYDSKFALGVLGVKTVLHTPFANILPNGNVSADTAQLMNAYKLSSRRECNVAPSANLLLARTPSTCVEVCQQIFNCDGMKKGVLVPVLRSVYLNRCMRNCHNSNLTEACAEANAFVTAAKARGVELQLCRECSTCNLKSLIVTTESAEVYILVSMSKNVVERDPKKSIRKLTSRLLERMQQDQKLINSKVGIVTYGGEGKWYEPRINVINGLTVTDQVEGLKNVIRRINFTGPSYRPESTRLALEKVGTTMKTAPSGIIKSVLVVAPETEENNCGLINMTGVIKTMNDDLSSVFLWSKMNQDQCEQRQEKIVTQTGGECIKPRRGDADVDQMVNAIVSRLSNKVRVNLRCKCDQAKQGDMKAQCKLVDSGIQY